MTSDSEHTVPVETFASKLTAKQLACRELGHRWAPSTVTVLASRGRVGGYERVMRCPSCGSRRKQLLDSRGLVLRNGYDYAEGYLADHVQRGFGREAFRLEALSRWVDQHPEATTQSEWTEEQ